MRLGNSWVVGLWALAAAGQAGAAGFELGEQGTRPLGTALAGIGTGTDELSASFWNPAGMAADPRSGVAAGASLISPSIEFSGQQPTGGDAGRAGYPPQVFARGDAGNGYILGFALNSPFGLRTQYDSDWAGRYHAIESDLEVVQGTLSLAKEVGSGLSLAAGVFMQELDVELTNAIKTPGGFADGYSRVTGESRGYGWLVGALWELEATTVGLSYHSSVMHEIEGTQQRRLPDMSATGNSTLTAISGSRSLGATADLELPARLVAGVRHAFTDGWRAMVSAQWSGWSSYDKLKVKTSGPTGTTTVREKDWDDAWSVAAGTEYDVNAVLTLRAGYRFEQTPVPDKEHRDPRLPDSDRQRLGVGATYGWGAGWSADLAYNYMDFGDAKIDNDDSADVSGNPETLNGEFDSNAQILSVQLNKRF
jgi:long-chain fatty acid transport protein